MFEELAKKINEINETLGEDDILEDVHC